MDILMPQRGETVAEGKITKWFKAAGDAVKPGDNLFEIETDKTSMEVPSTVAGTLSDIRFKVGEVAKVGAVVAVIAGALSPPKLPLPQRRPSQPQGRRHPLPRKQQLRRLPRRARSNELRRRSPIPTWTPSAKCGHPSAITGRPSPRGVVLARH